MDNFTKYEQLKQDGMSAEEVFLQAKTDGLDTGSQIRLLRQIFGLSLIEAKEIMVVAQQMAQSLNSYQEKLLPGLKRALEEDDSGNES